MVLEAEKSRNMVLTSGEGLLLMDNMAESITWQEECTHKTVGTIRPVSSFHQGPIPEETNLDLQECL
jgi:hypothetical protein